LQVKQYIQLRLKDVKPSTVNRELALLHRAFQLGYRQDPPLVGRVPYFPKLTESEPRRGFLKPEHYRNLLVELPQELKLLFVIAYHVGLRKGALLRIKWEQVDLPSSCIWMNGKKANRKPEPVAVPIYGAHAHIRGNATAHERVRLRWRLSADQGFPDELESGMPGCRPGLLFHDLRRTAVRNLRRAGVAESVIMKITGHRTRGVFERYNITDQSDTQEAGKMAEEFLNRAHAENLSQNRRRPN
jgi:integrase